MSFFRKWFTKLPNGKTVVKFPDVADPCIFGLDRVVCTCKYCFKRLFIKELPLRSGKVLNYADCKFGFQYFQFILFHPFVITVPCQSIKSRFPNTVAIKSKNVSSSLVISSFFRGVCSNPISVTS